MAISNAPNSADVDTDGLAAEVDRSIPRPHDRLERGMKSPSLNRYMGARVAPTMYQQSLRVHTESISRGVGPFHKPPPAPKPEDGDWRVANALCLRNHFNQAIMSLRLIFI